ncbi:Zc3h12a-like Ribonuclease NYN domain-containing protein [Sulfitobacter brevis]|uniref:Zc3h12a-like Ribonuclease NYN domain-containing protein n=1 Tax=Sulfitobacter brevis TaxID=74348 RepID=A0A1I1U0N8_9RHOB|nr:hypothetical protein [Sulfitobacter brevis]SFD61420.1 Zc3h12a-like Ribonuclease NYN domain-containing protein [Sulfitobacter brevis]
MAREPITLGDKLAPARFKKTGHFDFAVWWRNALFSVLNFALLTAISVLPLWWFLMRPELGKTVLLALLAALVALWFFVDQRPRGTKPHFLLAHDRQGFMHELILKSKTAIIDGSNIYHFGREKGLGAKPLGDVARNLRTQGYRVVCFFDANIFYTLMEHGAFSQNQPHRLALLENIFGLGKNEIYVVPSGVQADGYILETLNHLPISFAVTNDKFRDYANEYRMVMNDGQWRRGVLISNNQIKLQ